MTINGMASSGYNLFSSMNGTQGNSMFNMNFTDYNLIRSGSYLHLMQSYFGPDTDAAKKTSEAFGNKFNTATSKETNATLAKIESATDELSESSKALYEGNAKAFKKTDGQYDSEAIYKAVRDFVGDYNSVIKAAGKSDADGIARNAASLATVTNQNSDALKAVGISIDKDNFTMSLDKDTFLKADMNKVKNLFNGTGSYAYNVATKSSMLNYQAQREASKANTYGSTGSYNANYSSGSIYNGYF